MEEEVKKLTEELYMHFGKCIVPKGCFLFRRAMDVQIYSTMFFGFEIFATASAEYKTQKIQVWRVKEDITCIFPIKEITLNKWHKSSLGELCLKHLGILEADSHYLQIKKNDNPIRQRLITFLNQNNIYSWVSDCEGKVEMELFLFDDVMKNEKKVEFKGFAKYDDPKLDEYNYYKYVNIIHNPAITRNSTS